MVERKMHDSETLPGQYHDLLFDNEAIYSSFNVSFYRARLVRFDVVARCASRR